MTPEQERKIDGAMNWMKGNLPRFDWILRQKDDFHFYKREYARLSTKCEELEYRIKVLENKRQY